MYRKYLRRYNQHKNKRSKFIREMKKLVEKSNVNLLVVISGSHFYKFSHTISREILLQTNLIEAQL